MLLNSPAVERLVEAFRLLPGVGKRSAERMAMHVLSAPPSEAACLSEALREARERVVRCSECRNLTEVDPCSICSDERRDRKTLCVVEQPSGAIAIEKGGTFKGLYHVLHGVLNPLEGIGPNELEFQLLVHRVSDGPIAEVIVATNATTEGEATAMYISRELASTDATVTRIAHGVPMGGGIEYSDDVTLTHAMKGRTRL